MNTGKIYHHEAQASLLGGQPPEHSDPPFPSGGYHHREGYVPRALVGSRRKDKMYTPASLWTWAFLIVTTLQAAIVLGFESYVFAEFQSGLTEAAFSDKDYKAYTRTIPTFLTLYIFGFLYQLLLVYDALRLKNTIQVIGLCVYNVGLLIYAAVQMDQIKDAVNKFSPNHEINPNVWNMTRPFLVAIPCVIAVGTVFMSIVAWKLYDEFAWTIYKHISADLRMKRRYLTYQIYIALLKFDFFLFLGFTIQFVVIVEKKNDPEFGLTIGAIPVTIIILLMAAYWTRRESKSGMVAVIILYFAGLAYFLFKLVRMYHGRKVPNYIPVRRSLTTFAVITVILIILTIINACMCTNNFGRGLKPYIQRRKLESEDEKVAMNEMPNLAHGPVPSRMTID
ncbi:hypothetical protein LPUS_05547 [Lasallia pustulata]|uniref:Uncharacterized protein n=1 Tax=Lasallia pustulata TaxID=136370 RepID=A0A1W5CYZ9_9LECA|nr:hypothetical protein LPUS_05547 [Lasallia pustulata]